MPTLEQMRALIESHASHDDTRFYRTALQMAADEARRGHARSAQELRELVDGAKASSSVPRAARRPIPIAQARGELGELVAASFPDGRLDDVVLTDDLRGVLNRLLRENRAAERLRSHGLRPRRKVLLVGPPGTGKTMTARSLAGELKLPLYEVRFESMITKFMGESAAKLRLVFDAMNSARGVYLFDEFDAIGGQRALPNDTGEIRRVLNSFLQFIEQDESDSLIVCATNHAEILDRALVRRFDDVLVYALPSATEIVESLRKTLHSFETRDVDWAAIAERASGLSYADIVRACEDCAKDMLLDGRSELRGHDLEIAITARQRAHASLSHSPR